VWTLAGGLASLVISIGLVKAFTSAIVGPEVLTAPSFALAVAIGAAAWVIVASATGLPVSTTHALTGAIVGVAVVAGGGGSVRWWMLLSGIAAPLALSPLVSAAIGYAMHAAAVRIAPACVCVRDEITLGTVDSAGTIAGVLVPRVVASTSGCAAADTDWPAYALRAPARSRRSLGGGGRFMPAGALHWGAAAALSFARAVNDNAKLAAIAALGVPAFGAGLWAAFAVTAAAMTIGSYVAGVRVTRTLGERVVHMDQDTGLAAALVSAALVLAASFHTLPVSTTHVSTGAIIGAGARQGGDAVDWRSVALLIGAWVGTLPVAAVLGGMASWLLTPVVG
jgi:PiT family inorganic phosphate transporter